MPLILMNPYSSVTSSTPPFTPNVTWNPNDKNTGAVLSNNNLTYAGFSGNAVRANIGKTTGKWYWEVKIDQMGSSAGPLIGAAIKGAQLQDIWGADGTTLWYVSIWGSSGVYQNRNLIGGFAPSAVTGDVIGVMMDLDLRRFRFTRNGVLQPDFIQVLNNEAYYPAVSDPRGGVGTECILTGRFDPSTFSYPLPDGYSAL